MGKGILVKLKVAPGKNEIFESVFAEQAANCSANEPGQELYQLLRSPEDRQIYYLFELYQSDEALQAHRSAPHMALTRSRIRECLVGEYSVTILDQV